MSYIHIHDTPIMAVYRIDMRIDPLVLLENKTVEKIVFVYRLSRRMKSGICKEVLDKFRDFGYRRLDECA